MTGRHPLPDAVQWHEGMLLAPQHFQQDSTRGELLLHYHLSALAPYHWGVLRFVVDPSFLVGGIFRVTELEAVMPDGLVVSHPDSRGLDLEVDVTPLQERMQDEAVPVYLTVPARRPGEAAGEAARFESVESDPLTDENTGEGELRIAVLRPRLGLIAGAAPPQRYVSLPLGHVAYRDETFVLTEYIPPMLSVPLDSALGKTCAEIAKRLREKAAFLAERTRSPSASGAGAMVLETKATVQALVAALPPFEAVVNTGKAHPYQVYLAMAGLAGQLAVLSTGLLPPAMPPYRHDDIRGSFAAVTDFVLRMIENIQESYMALTFTFSEGMFHIRLSESWTGPGRLVIGARARSGQQEADAAKWIEGAMIGSAERIPSMRDKRVLGPRRRRIDSDESLNLFPSRGTVLVSIDIDPDFIDPGGVLQIINRGDPKGEAAPAEVTLYAPNMPASA